MGIGTPFSLNAERTLNFYITGVVKKGLKFPSICGFCISFSCVVLEGVDIWLCVPNWPCTAYSCQNCDCICSIYLQVHTHQNVCPCYRFFNCNVLFTICYKYIWFSITFSIKKTINVIVIFGNFFLKHIEKIKFWRSLLKITGFCLKDPGLKKVEIPDVSCSSLYLSFSKYNTITDW